MKRVKLFSAQTDDADDAAKELQQLLSEWMSRHPERIIDSATTSVGIAYDPDSQEPLVSAIMTVVFREPAPPKED